MDARDRVSVRVVRLLHRYILIWNAQSHVFVGAGWDR